MLRILVLLASCAGLSACEMAGLNLTMPNLGGAKIQTEAVVTRDQITLAGPRGFCVDSDSSVRTNKSAFVVFGNCAAISGKPDAPQPVLNAIVTSTVRVADPSMPRIGTSSSQLEKFFETPVGQILLSRSNTPDSIDVLESGVNDNGAFFLYVTDTSEGAPAGTNDTYWRAYLDAKNSLVTVSVLSLDANPLTRAEGLEILRDFTIAIQSVPKNQPTDQTFAEPTAVTPAASEDTQRPLIRPTGDSPADAQKPRKGILGRLFG